MKYKCSVCGYIYDESVEGKSWDSLPENWTCPVCGVGKEMFVKLEEGVPAEKKVEESAAGTETHTASDLIAETLENWGVRWVFGMVGHSNLGMGDAIRKRALAGTMNYIGIRHEGAAAFACSAYGKLTGTPAACLTIAGPGATNLITGLADASLDHSPVIALTGQIPTPDLGFFAFQELDLFSAFKAVASSQQQAMEHSDFSALASTACRNAILNRAVSQIILPDDVQVASVPANKPAGTLIGAKPPSQKTIPPEDELNRVVEFIASARKPIIIVGEGCRWAIPEVFEFAGTLNAPIMTTYRAKGFVGDRFPLACGVVGRSGTLVSAKIMAESDCIIGLGVGFSKHSEIIKGVPIVQIDRDPRAIGRLRKVDLSLVGDLAGTLPLLSRKLSGGNASTDRRAQIAELWNEWRAEKNRRAEKSLPKKIAPAALGNALTAVIPPDAVVSVDVGNVAYSFGRYFEATNQRFLLSFYLGSIGVGLPSAMGAWCATKEEGFYKNRPVVAIVGDGGLGQYLAEWTTVVKYGMNIKCVVFNNSELAKISLEQRNAKVEVWETALVNPSFAEFSKLCGGAGIRISEPANLESELARAFAIDGPVMIEVCVDPDAN